MIITFPFIGSFSPKPFWNFMDATPGYRHGFIRRLFLPITLRKEEEFARNALQAARIKHDSRPLHLIKSNRWQHERTARWDVRKGKTGLSGI